jgi:hypothetical protein
MFDDFKEWLSDNLRYIILFVAIILVIVAVGLAMVFIKGMDKNKKAEPVETTAATETSQTDVLVDTSAAESEAGSEAENELKEDAIPEVNEVVKKYYDGINSSDIDGLKQVVDNLTDENIKSFQDLGNFIEDYRDIKVYTKEGPVDNSYVAFVSYKIKFKNVEALAPGLACMYISANEDGNFYITNKTDEEVSAYMDTVSQDADVVALKKQIDDEYVAARESDENLSALTEELKKSEPVEENTSLEQSTESSKDVQVNKVVKTVDICNVRSDSRPDAELLGTLASGADVTKVRTLDNGWTEVKYGDGKGYIKSELLSE